MDGGEYFADRFILHLAKRLTGVEVVRPPEEDEFDYDDLGTLRITGTIEAPDGLGHAAAYRRERDLAGGVRKATVVTPLEMLTTATGQQLPRSMELAAGIVDEANYWVEPVKKIQSRAADWARVVGEERLWVQPSCGFGRHAARDREVLEPKMANLAEAAATF